MLVTDGKQTSAQPKPRQWYHRRLSQKKNRHSEIPPSSAQRPTHQGDQIDINAHGATWCRVRATATFGADALEPEVRSKISSSEIAISASERTIQTYFPFILGCDATIQFGPDGARSTRRAICLLLTLANCEDATWHAGRKPNRSPTNISAATARRPGPTPPRPPR